MHALYLYMKKKNKGNLSFINEIEKLEKQDIIISNNLNEEGKGENKINISNITVTSDFCGLGKTFKIKKMIKKKNQNYFHFPLGGILTKKIISRTIKNLL